MSSWDEGEGRVSHSFNDWYWVDQDQRAYLRLGLKFANEAYERIWRESGEEPGDSEGPEQIDVFEDRVDGLHGHDFKWMLLSGVLRDAVTGYEVYVEKLREEILRHQEGPSETPERAPEWWRQSKFLDAIGIDIEPGEVKRVRDLRHFLTHRRGELRTEKSRAIYAPEAELFGPMYAELSEEQVLADMGALGNAVRGIDAAAYPYLWAGQRLPQ